MYKEITHIDSPNFTPGNKSRSVFGYDRVVNWLVIHHWDDPARNPTFDGTIKWLCRPGGNSSSHSVVEAGRVAFLVNPWDVAWAAGHPLLNAQGIQIECNPRASKEDIETVCELVAFYRHIYGDITLTGHGWWVNTQCPGRYDVNYIDVRSYEIGLKKYGSRHG